MLSVQNISKSFGLQKIFENVTFSIMPGEKVGLVGRNGHGKTTIAKILTGEELPDSGNVVAPKGYSIGYLNQHTRFSEPTVLSEACLALPENRKNEEWKVKKTLSGLGFNESDFYRPCNEFSGGYQMRINLAKVLVQEPDLLLLDEPTNFLDIVSIKWLESFLNLWKGELILITHDRTFMDSVTTHVMGIHRHNLRKVLGNTSSYYSQIEQEETVFESHRLNQEKKQKQMEVFISKFRAKARQANLVQSRIKTLEKMQVESKLTNISKLSFKFEHKYFPAKKILEATNIKFSYSGKEPYLINNVNLVVEANDRICIVGRNGKGKSTLLRILAKKLSAISGNVKIHTEASIGYYEQANTADLQDNLTVLDEITKSNPSSDRTSSRAICGAMMFSGDDALKTIKNLSGGEKSRVLLGKLLVAPSNLLVLDEPTHHLDMQSIEALIDAVDSFEGASVIVTHDERMLRRLASKLIVFKDNQIFVFNGNYDAFIKQYPWEDASMKVGVTKDSNMQPDKTNGKPVLGKKELRRKRADFVSRKSKELSPLKNRIKILESKIELLEKDHEENTEKLIELSTNGDGKAISKISKNIAEIENEVNDRYNELETCMLKLDELEQKFNKEELLLDC